MKSADSVLFGPLEADWSEMPDLTLGKSFSSGSSLIKGVSSDIFWGTGTCPSLGDVFIILNSFLHAIGKRSSLFVLFWHTFISLHIISLQETGVNSDQQVSRWWSHRTTLRLSHCTKCPQGISLSHAQKFYSRETITVRKCICNPQSSTNFRRFTLWRMMFLCSGIGLVPRVWFQIKCRFCWGRPVSQDSLLYPHIC